MSASYPTASGRSRKAALVIPDVSGMTNKEAAHAYLDAGLMPHPWRVVRGTKASCRKGFHFDELNETHEDIDQWPGTWRCGLVTSKASGLIAGDVDDLEAFREWDADFDTDTAYSHTGRDSGYHLLFDCRGLAEWPTQGDIPGGQIKSNGFIAVEPSKHPNGKMYKWARREVASGEQFCQAVTNWRGSGTDRGAGGGRTDSGLRGSDSGIEEMMENGVEPGKQHIALHLICKNRYLAGKSKISTYRDWKTVLSNSVTGIDPDGGSREPWMRADFDAKWRAIEAKFSAAERDLRDAGFEPAKQTKDRGKPEKKSNGRHIVLTPASEIEPEIVEWLWEDDWRRIPLAEVVLTAGHGGVGKSTANMWLIARVTKGELPGRYYRKPRNCLIAATEDSWKRTVIPRLMAAGADRRRVFRVDVTTEDYDGLALSLPADFEQLEKAINDKRAAVLLIDPLMRTMPADRDASKPQDARLTLEPLSGIADRTNCTIIGNCHFNKSGQTDPVFRILGSIEIQNIARGIIRFASKDGVSVMSCGKNTHGPVWPSIEYALEEASVIHGSKRLTTSKFVLGEETDVSADDFLRAEGRQGTGESVTSQAAIWLAGYMGRHSDKVDAKDAIEAGEAEGFNKRMLQRVLKKLGGETARVGGLGKKGSWIWYIPGSTKQRISGNSEDDDDYDE